MLKASTPLSRRTCLQAGGLSAFGLSSTQLLNAIEGKERASLESTLNTGKAKSCILLYMLGGPPQQETFDMKPEAPGSARSLFPAIATNVPGIEICGLLPDLARHADRFAIIRSVHHSGNALFHGAGVHYNLTGFPNIPREGEPFLDRRDYPSIGSVLNQLRGSQHGLPASVQLPMWITQDGPEREWAGQHAGFLGRQYDPLVMDYGYLKFNMDFNQAPTSGEASLPGALLPGFSLNEELKGSRLGKRLELQRSLGRPQIGDGATNPLRLSLEVKCKSLNILQSVNIYACSTLRPPENLIAEVIA